MQAGDRLGGVYADHVHEGDHDVAHPLGVQLADAADHLPLLGLQDARPHGGLQHEVELLLRHVGRLRSVYGDAKHAEEDLDDPVELPADRVNDLGDPEVPWQGDAGKLVGVAHRDALRDNLAEDQLQDGDRHGGDRQAAPSEELRADLCDEGRAEHAREGRPNEDRLHEPLDVRAQRRPHAQPPAPGLLRPLYLPLRQLPDLPGPEGRDRSLRAGAAAEYEEEEAPQREVHGEGAADGLVVHHPEGEAAGEAPGRDPPGHARRPDRRPQQRPAAGHEAGGEQPAPGGSSPQPTTGVRQPLRRALPGAPSGSRRGAPPALPSGIRRAPPCRARRVRLSSVPAGQSAGTPACGRTPRPMRPPEGRREEHRRTHCAKGVALPLDSCRLMACSVPAPSPRHAWRPRRVQAPCSVRRAREGGAAPCRRRRRGR
mmetsp:Transcript_74895/g.236692  ORF Transcript_74895/g.236692 Transcript_74895/m.236692 type:complete len:428 (+) Transcript_74895:1301-2584(+)